VILAIQKGSLTLASKLEAHVYYTPWIDAPAGATTGDTVWCDITILTKVAGSQRLSKLIDS